MVRNERQRERQQERKQERLAATTHGGYGGKSILELITDQLDEAVARYLAIKESGHGNPPTMSTARGEVRGLARALTIFAVPTYPSIAAAEKAAVRRVKARQDAQEREAAEEERRQADAAAEGDGAGSGD